MNAHFAETMNLATKGLTSDTFAKHFASHFTEEGYDKKRKKESKVSISQSRKLMKVSILW